MKEGKYESTYCTGLQGKVSSASAPRRQIAASPRARLRLPVDEHNAARIAVPSGIGPVFRLDLRS